MLKSHYILLMPSSALEECHRYIVGVEATLNSDYVTLKALHGEKNTKKPKTLKLCVDVSVMLKLLFFLQGERGAVGYPGASGRSGVKVLTGNNEHYDRSLVKQLVLHVNFPRIYIDVSNNCFSKDQY